MLLHMNAQKSLFDDSPAGNGHIVLDTFKLCHRIWRQQQKMITMRNALLALPQDSCVVASSLQSYRQAQWSIQQHRQQKQLRHAYAVMCANQALLRFKAGPLLCFSLDCMLALHLQLQSLKVLLLKSTYDIMSFCLILRLLALMFFVHPYCF